MALGLLVVMELKEAKYDPKFTEHNPGNLSVGLMLQARGVARGIRTAGSVIVATLLKTPELRSAAGNRYIGRMVDH